MQHYRCKTNVTSDIARDEVRSAFKSDKRIWSLTWIKEADGDVIEVDAELTGAELLAKITALGFEGRIDS